LIVLISIVCDHELSRDWDWILSILSEFHSGFWNFPETVWWSRATRQAAQAPDPVFWVFSMNCLAAEDDPPGDANTVTQFLLFWIFLGYL